MAAPVITHALKVIGGSMLGGLFVILGVGILIGAGVMYFVMKSKQQPNPKVAFA